jgi:methionyl aminopeptidase
MIELKSEYEIEKIRESGRMTAQVLKKLREMVKPGVATIELDETARKMTKGFGAKPAFLNYNGFPFAVCISMNSEVVHGFPSKKRILKEGDIVSLDFGVEYKGFFSDSAITVGAGKVAPEVKKLMDITEQSLYKGIDQAKAGGRLGDISAAVQKYAESFGFSVVRDYVGHGVGRRLHEDPQVPNYGKKGSGLILEPGLVIAIEPMINSGNCEVEVLENDWTVVTSDGSPSAHFEHTVAITKDGPQILTNL